MPRPWKQTSPSANCAAGSSCFAAAMYPFAAALQSRSPPSAFVSMSPTTTWPSALPAAAALDRQRPPIEKEPAGARLHRHAAEVGTRPSLRVGFLPSRRAKVLESARAEAAGAWLHERAAGAKPLPSWLAHRLFDASHHSAQEVH